MRPLALRIIHAVLALAAVVAFAVAYSTAGPLFHLEKVRVEGSGGWQLRSDQIRDGLSESGSMSLVFGDFLPLASAVEAIPSIRSAQIRKVYPDQLVVEVEAREPVARSEDGGLIDRNGDWYQGSTSLPLPVFVVPRRMLPQAVSLYSDMAEELDDLDLNINQLRRNEKGWLLFLSNGWVLLLGERRLRERLRRFANSWFQLPMEIHVAANLRFDLRYPHGMAVAGFIPQEEGNDG